MQSKLLFMNVDAMMTTNDNIIGDEKELMMMMMTAQHDDHDDHEHYRALLSPYEQYSWDVTKIIRPISSALSIFGSLWIMLDIVLFNRKKKLYQEPYNRIMFGLSFFDLCASFWMFARGFLEGSNGACIPAGFFSYVGAIAIPLYNVALAIYFSLSVQYNWRGNKITTNFERYTHPIIITIALSLAIIAIPLGLYNDEYLYCFPFNLREPSEMSTARDVYFVIYCSVVLVSTLVVACTMMFIYCHVTKVLKKGRRFSFEETKRRVYSASSGSLHIQNRRSSPENTDLNGRRITIRPNNKMSRRVRTMALLYTLPYIITWVVPLIWQIMLTFVSRGRGRGRDFVPTIRTTFVMSVYTALCMPLQGFMNWFIYMLPQFQQKMKCTKASFYIITILKRLFPCCWQLDLPEHEVDISASSDIEEEEEDTNESMVENIWSHPQEEAEEDQMIQVRPSTSSQVEKKNNNGSIISGSNNNLKNNKQRDEEENNIVNLDESCGETVAIIMNEISGRTTGTAEATTTSGGEASTSATTEDEESPPLSTTKNI